MKLPRTSITIFCLALASSLGFAQDGRAAGAEQRMAELRARLELSDTQVEALTPVLEQSMATQRGILSRYGINLESDRGAPWKLGRRDALAMKKELDAIRTDTLHAVDDILTDKQLAEFKRIQNERRATMQKRIQVGP
jgi:hypothetical protein